MAIDYKGQDSGYQQKIFPKDKDSLAICSKAHTVTFSLQGCQHEIKMIKKQIGSSAFDPVWIIELWAPRGKRLCISHVYGECLVNQGNGLCSNLASATSFLLYINISDP